MSKFFLQLSIRCLLIVSGLLISLGFMEIGARWLGPPYEQSAQESFQCQRQVGWIGKPHGTKLANTDGYRHEVVRNAQGMHDTEHPFEKATGVFRILMLGDSFVDAGQVHETETNHQRLEDMLNASSGSPMTFELISAGIGAWGPAQELAYFDWMGQRYQPDLVLALWMPANDLLDILPDYPLTYGGMNCYAPYYAMCDGQFDPHPWMTAPGLNPVWKHCPHAGKKLIVHGLNQLYHSSRLYQRLEPLLIQTTHRLEYGHPYAPWLPSHQNDELLQYAYQLTAELYSHLATQADTIGAKTALVIVPAKQAVHAEADSMTIIPPGTAQEPLDPTLPNQSFLKIMHAKGLPVLDLQPAFVQAQQQGTQPLYWNGDSHWTVRGNELAAEQMAAWLMAEKLVPSD